MELLVVVLLIGILTVMAMPSMSTAQIDRRAYNDAILIAELFREARTRAMGRGAAEMILMTTTGSQTGTDRGTFQLWEGQVLALPAMLPLGSPMTTCGSPTLWPATPATGQTTTATGATAVLADGVNLNGTIEAQDQIWTTFSGPSVQTTGALGGIGALTAAYMCFTPLGHTYFTAGNSGTNFVAGSPMLGELQIAVKRARGGVQVGITRTVVVPNSGATRIMSK